MNNKINIIRHQIADLMCIFDTTHGKENRSILSRKIFDYIIVNFDFMIKHKCFTKFFEVFENKLLEFKKSTNALEYFDILQINFYQKFAFPDKYSKLTYDDIKNFNASRNIYYQEDQEIRDFFDKFIDMQNKNQNINENKSNLYYPPSILNI